MFAINLGGEGEVADTLNQQPPGAAGPNWKSVHGLLLVDLIQTGGQYLICPNKALALPDDCVDVVYTNSVPVDQPSTLGPGVQSSEIQRILKSGGVWIRDGVPYYTKP